MSNLENVQQLFQAGYARTEWLQFLRDLFPRIGFFQLPQKLNDSKADSFTYLGNALPDGQSQPLGIYEIRVGSKTQLSRNRVQLRQMVAKQSESQNLCGALAVYVDENDQRWRFSFIAIEYRLDDDNRLSKEQTASKRFTYILGKGANTRTAVQRFAGLPPNPSLEDLKSAFAVETLNKEFYSKMYEWYEVAQKQVTFPDDEKAANHIATSLIRMLTRLLFVWFIKEKRLVNADLFIEDKLRTILHWDKDSSYYKAILQNLFFATLNREITDRSFRRTTDGKANSSNYLVTNIYRYQDYFQDNDEKNIIALFDVTPFLNGGLFECLDREATDREKQEYDENNAIRPVRSAIRMDGFSDREDNAISIPNFLFFNSDETGLIDLLSQYQFTVEESTPLDIEVALDPELLGLVFEKLLAAYNPETQESARNATGSFYTPREIVAYMVDESLRAYLTETVKPHDDDEPFWRERLSYLFDQASRTGEIETRGDSPLIYNEEIPLLIAAIDQVKILDPAVGSGAFPMGCLQRLVQLLAVLDPDNEQWKKQQLNSLPALNSIQTDLQIAKQISDHQARKRAEEELQNRKQEIIAAFEVQDHSYARKLYLIQNAIYGVDIQPIAVQIAKLRFFISLAIEQTPTQDKENNYGIKPLPNLETRFIAADTLISLTRPNQIRMRNPQIDQKERQLNSIRRRYFAARTLKAKRDFKEVDKRLRREIAGLLIEDGWQDHNAHKIAELDLYDRNAAADWFDPEWMFGLTNGFDLVIGNPPYIQLQNDKGKLGNYYKDVGYISFNKKGDVYQLFYERGCQLLKTQHGILCFITSNSWLKAKSGSKLRKYFDQHHAPLRLLEIGKDVFENAIVDVNILLLRNGKSKVAGKAVDMDRLPSKQFPPEVKYWSVLRPKDDKPWVTLSAVEQQIMDKIETVGTPLREWDISIYRGVLTGYNEAFIVDNETKERLIQEDSRSAELLKPVLRGKDIGRYQVNWAGLWLITTFPALEIVIDDYPAIKQHLRSFGRTRLEQAGQTLPDGTKSRKRTPHAWYELQDTCAYHELFKSEKLIWITLVENGRFTYDPCGFYCIDSSFIMTGDSIKYICAILNTMPSSWYFKQIAPTSGKGTPQWKKPYVENIPIPRPSLDQKDRITRLVDQISTAKARDPKADVSTLEAEINQTAYTLFDLDAKEVSFMS